MIKLEVKDVKKQVEISLDCNGTDIKEILYGIAKLWILISTYYKAKDKDILKLVKATMKDMRLQDEYR